MAHNGVKMKVKIGIGHQDRGDFDITNIKKFDNIAEGVSYMEQLLTQIDEENGDFLVVEKE